jgi:hypothetical protein
VARSRWSSGHVCRFADVPILVVQKIAPWPAFNGFSARDGSSGPGRAEDERARLSRPLHEGSGPSVRRAMLPNRGVRERLSAMAGCHTAPEGKGSLCCGYKENRCLEKPGIRPQCLCRQRGCAWGVATAEQSSFSQLRLSENRRKQFFIFNDAARCMQRRRQRFPTVRTVG